MATDYIKSKNRIDVIKYRWLWLLISAIVIVPGIVAMIYSTLHFGFPIRPGIDFTGGTMLQYGTIKKLNTEDIPKIKEALNKVGIESPVIQISDVSANIKQKSKKDLNSVITMRTRFLSSEKGNNEISKVNDVLASQVGEFIPLQVSAVGPTLGKELFKNALAALLLAFGGIVLYLAFRFQWDYALFALVALFHDAFFVCGMFSIFGLLFGTEIDSLFITAIMTVIGFSVHDTIVVFDRIRENSRFLSKKMTFNDIVNASVNQTLARSINTSLTALFVLLSLYFLGGSTTKDFVFAMILGIAIGTYSSIFNASVLLAMWRSRKSANIKTS